MGKKKGFNWKARLVKETKIDNSQTEKITVELPAKEYGAEDACNTAVLPSSKRPTKVKADSKKTVRILSRKQRKRLESIVEKKKKKENRAALLEELAKVQIPNEQLLQMTSIASVQSRGLKKNLHSIESDVINDCVAVAVESSNEKSCDRKKINSVSGAKKRRYLLALNGNDKKKKMKKDLNVVGFESSSSSDDEEPTEDTDYEKPADDVENENIENEETIEAGITIENDKNTPKEVVILSDDETNVNDSAICIKKENDEKVEGKKRRRKPKEKDTENVNKNKKDEIILPKRETVFVEVNRTPKIQTARLSLPILAEEQMVVEKINNNAIVLIVGETGSGKTTQVPQFLYEAGYARNGKIIGITEPRRVAAVAMSNRVATEMNLTSREVSYLMRYEGNVTDDTKIKFMTDGVLLKEIETDFLLTKYSVIIIDEAHERSVFTDILIGLLSRIVPLRCKKQDPLRLIVMSATLRIEDFTENDRLFRSPPPVVKIDVRQFPVTVHFNKRTDDDYLKAAFSKAVKIHTKLPEGGILIFVTGQQEVKMLVNKLRKAFPLKKDKKSGKKSKENSDDKPTEADGSSINDKIDSEASSGEEKDDDDEIEKILSMKKARKKLRERKKRQEIVLPKIDLDDFDVPDEEVKNDLLEKEEDMLDGSGDEEDWESLVPDTAAGPLWVLPLYSMLPPTEQAKVFQPPPQECRVCVVATNVAETSLTIPNIKYVVDTGKQKIRIYERVTGASAMRIVWTSQASAEQRAGRAGRCAPGHCYRLYSSAVFQHEFPVDKEPEIRMRPVDDLLLQMKCMGIDKVVNFPFPSAPDVLQLKSAELRLETLGALEKPSSSHSAINTAQFSNSEETLRVTPLGRAISGYPVLPRYGKMLALSHQHDLFQYTLCIVAALSVQEVFIGQRRKWLAFGENLLLGDPGLLLNIVGGSEHAALSGEDMEAWCNSQGVRWRALREIRLLRGQISGGSGVPSAPSKPPGSLARPLRQILLSGLGDCVARKVPLEDIKIAADKLKYKYAYNCPDMEEPVFIHSGSVLRKTPPEWVVYQELYEAGEGDQAKMIIRGITAIEPEWLPIYVPKLCNLGEPLMEPPPRYDPTKDRMLCHVNATFGRSGWELPKTEIDFPKIAEHYRWFAVYLLDGSVVGKLRKYAKTLLSPANTMIKSWAKLQPRTETMYRALLMKQICNKKMLIEEWKRNPNYLLDAYKKWLPESAHEEVSLFWPPI